MTANGDADPAQVLKRLIAAIPPKAMAWDRIFSAFAPGEREAWSNFTATIARTTLPASITNLGFFAAPDWLRTAYENIFFGGIRATDLMSAFEVPFIFGLKMLEIGVLAQRTTPKTDYWQFDTTGMSQLVRPISDHAAFVSKRIAGQNGAVSELRLLMNDPAILQPDNLAGEVRSALFAMLYSPLFYPSAADPANFANLLERHLWVHYLKFLTSNGGINMRNGARFYDFSAMFDRFNYFGFDTPREATIYTIPTFSIWAIQRATVPLIIDAPFPGPVQNYIRGFNIIPRAVLPMKMLLKQTGPTLAGAGV